MPYFLLLFWLWLPGGTPAPPALAPLQIAEQFVANGSWPAMKSYLCCEATSQAKRQSLGQQIPARMRRTCELLQQNSATAVVAVELCDSVEQKDFYLHFSKDSSGWKLSAIRSLAMTQFAPPMLRILTAMPPNEVAQYNRKHPDASHAFMVGNMHLWTAADADIKAYFNLHRTDFQELVRLVQAGKFLTGTSTNNHAGEQAANADPIIHRRLQQLFITRVGNSNTDCESCVDFLIAGMVDNTVGLLYAPKPASLPAMSPNQLIVLRPLGEGWYLYKTS